MSKQRANPWQCVGKFAFRTAAMAKQVARRMSQRRKGAITAYHCVACDGWHVGSRSIKARGKRR